MAAVRFCYSHDRPYTEGVDISAGTLTTRVTYDADVDFGSVAIDEALLLVGYPALGETYPEAQPSPLSQRYLWLNGYRPIPRGTNKREWDIVLLYTKGEPPNNYVPRVRSITRGYVFPYTLAPVDKTHPDFPVVLLPDTFIPVNEAPAPSPIFTPLLNRAGERFVKTPQVTIYQTKLTVTTIVKRLTDLWGFVSTPADLQDFRGQLNDEAITLWGYFGDTWSWLMDDVIVDPIYLSDDVWYRVTFIMIHDPQTHIPLVLNSGMRERFLDPGPPAKIKLRNIKDANQRDVTQPALLELDGEKLDEAYDPLDDATWPTYIISPANYQTNWAPLGFPPVWTYPV